MRSARLPRLSTVPVLSDTDERAKRELVGFLSRGKGEDLLRRHVQHGQVKLVEHLIRLVRRERTIAYRVGCYLIATYGRDGSNDGSNNGSLCTPRDHSIKSVVLPEMDAEARENPLEARWLVGDLDSAGKTELLDDINDHLVALTVMRDTLAADVYGAALRPAA